MSSALPCAVTVCRVPYRVPYRAMCRTVCRTVRVCIDPSVRWTAPEPTMCAIKRINQSSFRCPPLMCAGADVTECMDGVDAWMDAWMKRA
uniref:Uncharacterized protein n=1 Tax=Picea glauca TaxID=3330 RepID=A0A101LTR7_PICGL|nr:hypothetical protein ABT39_MTgene3583 [Picea glauca]QHR89024.1 hypothetical protein Q903MT_gene3043 [Picea sitchensis]